jgi:ABC-2 type transport system ATP-binding protein
VQLDEIWFRYGRGPWILRGVTAHLDAGEAATIAGRNGAGKSTLLSVAAGLLRPNRGAVRDRPASVGYVPERFPADQPFTARAYLTAMAAVSGRRPADTSDDIRRWAERLHFTGLLDRPLGQLSKGSAQKVGLIQAMLCEPDLLILDEPWEGLDGPTRAEVPPIIAEVLAAGGRVLISDHQGQTADLDGMRRWSLVDGDLREAVPGVDSPAGDWVVEVAVAASEVEATVANLRAAGLDVVNVRGRRTDAT